MMKMMKIMLLAVEEEVLVAVFDPSLPFTEKSMSRIAIELIAILFDV